MLKKLQFLFDLPKELADHVAADEYAEVTIPEMTKIRTEILISILIATRRFSRSLSCRLHFTCHWLFRFAGDRVLPESETCTGRVQSFGQFPRNTG